MNSIYNPSSLSALNLSSEPSGNPKGILKITIRDTGCGIKPEKMKDLFKKFNQVSELASERQVGSGLGLFITK